MHNVNKDFPKGKVCMSVLLAFRVLLVFSPIVEFNPVSTVICQRSDIQTVFYDWGKDNKIITMILDYILVNALFKTVSLSKCKLF